MRLYKCAYISISKMFETLLSCGLLIYFIAVLWLASLGQALAEIPSTTCWPPGRDASPTRSEEGQSSQPPNPSIFISLSSCIHKPDTLQSWTEEHRADFNPEGRLWFLSWNLHKLCALAGETSHTCWGESSAPVSLFLLHLIYTPLPPQSCL